MGRVALTRESIVSTTIKVGKDVRQDLRTFPSVRCLVSPCFLAEN